MARHKKHIKNPYLTYAQAQKYVLNEITPPPQTRAQYWRWHDENKPAFLPKRPDKVYDNFSWNDFLNTTNSFEKTRDARTNTVRTYRDYWPAVRYAQAQAKSFNLSTREDWMTFYEEYEVPDDIPKRPWQVYDEFSIDAWLGLTVKGHLETAKNVKRIVALHHASGMPANCIVVKVWADGVVGTDDSGMLGGVVRAFVLEDDQVLKFIDHKIKQHGHQRDGYYVVPNLNALLWDLVDLPMVRVG